MFRNVFAVVAGVFAMMIVITGLEALDMRLYPPPPELNLRDPAQLRQAVDIMPLMAKQLVVLGWLLGAFVGGFVAARIAHRRRLFAASIVGGLVCAGTIANAMQIPHPIWMTFIGSVLPLPLAWAAGRWAIALAPVADA